MHRIGVVLAAVIALTACGGDSAIDRRLDEEGGRVLARGTSERTEWAVWAPNPDLPAMRAEWPCLSYSGLGSGGGSCFVMVPDSYAVESRAQAIDTDRSVVFGVADPRAVRVRVVADGVDVGVAVADATDRFGVRYFVAEVEAPAEDLRDAVVYALDVEGAVLGADGHYVWETPPPLPS